MSLETSVSERGEKEVRDCVFVVMKFYHIFHQVNAALVSIIDFKKMHSSVKLFDCNTHT